MLIIPPWERERGLMLVIPAIEPRSGALLPTRFTVGRSGGHAGNERLMSLCAPKAAQSGVITYPFHCWSTVLACHDHQH